MTTDPEVTAASLRDDLAAEQDVLDAVVADLSDESWSAASPSEGWTVADQIGHLSYFDATATTAIEDPERFSENLVELIDAASDGADAVDELVLGPHRALDPAELLHTWRANRQGLLTAAATLDDRDRVPWYGPSMSARSFLTARLMEVWAHGQDIVDALGVTRPAGDRLRHIAQLGYITRGWSYTNRGLDAPESDVLVELAAPTTGTWSWGDESAEDSVRGPAEDFCLVVTQRRHIDDTDLVVTGEAALDWMHLAQAFAGPATDGPSRQP